MTTWANLPEADRQRLRERVAAVSLRAEQIAARIRRRPWIKSVLVHQVVAECVACHKAFTITCHRDHLENWLLGTLIQGAMPYLTDGERELLMSGMCGECFDKLLGEDEDAN